MKYVSICMVRPHMRDMPQFAFPEGFSVRLYRPGDAEHWVRIHELADFLASRSMQTFNEQFGHDLPAMEDRCFFLLAPDGQVVGTTTAWWDDDFCGRPCGRIHWVAIVPEFQGRGLAKPLMTVAMNRLARQYDRSRLITQAPRLPAIHLYLNFGFRPFVETEAEQVEWDKVRRGLAHPLLDQPVLTRQTL